MPMKKRLIILLVCLNIAIFITTIILLPQSSTYSFRNTAEKFINSRENWEIAWVVLLSSIILSVGVYIFAEGHYQKEEWK